MMLRNLLVIFLFLLGLAVCRAQEGGFIAQSTLQQGGTSDNTVVNAAQTTAGTTITFSNLWDTATSTPSANPGLSWALCFVSGTDSATNFTWNSATFSGATGVKIWESPGTGSTEIAAFWFHGLTLDAAADASFTASEDVATNTGAYCAYGSSGAYVTQAIQSSTGSTPVTLNVSTSSPGNVFCYSTSVNGTDRTYTWSSTNGIVTVNEWLDGDVENATRTHSEANVSIGTTAAAYTQPLDITVTVSGSSTSLETVCIPLRVGGW